MPISKPETFRLVAQLQATDLSAAAWALTDRFGFKAETGYLDTRNLPKNTDILRLRRLNQVVELVLAKPGMRLGHGPFDHLALKSRDVDAATMALRAKWVRLDPDVTPDGPVTLPMFWSHGVRIAFALGPQDARIELCQNYAAPPENTSRQVVNLGGHDHFGVRCRDVEEATEFYTQFGFIPVENLTIPTPDGEIEVRFAKRGAYLLEIASTPATRAPGSAFADQPIWSRIIIETDTPADGEASNIGPNGEVVEVRSPAPETAFHFNAEELQ